MGGTARTGTIPLRCGEGEAEVLAESDRPFLAVDTAFSLHTHLAVP